MTANVNQPAFVVQGPTVNITPTATTATVRVRAAGQSAGQARHVRVWNSHATLPVFIESGPTTATASTTASMPIPPGSTNGGGVAVVSLQGDWVAVVASTSAGVVYFTPGEGL